MTAPSPDNHNLDNSNLAKRQQWAKHLRDQHGYATLDTVRPVSEAALARICQNAGCQHQEAS